MNRMKTDRFFIPRAEEYIKSGMLDEAIAVLKEGLQAYPNYLGARVSLGRAYLEKGMIQEAMKEFEHVVQVSPDNLFAHRKLVSIYKDLERIDDAIKACETLLVFSPKDKEAAALLSNLMNEKSESVPESDEHPERRQKITPSHQEVEGIDFTSAWEVAPEGGREEEHEEVIEEFATETMGDLFIAQGKIEKGVEIYRRILDREPANESVREKLFDLTDRRKVQINRLQDFLGRIQKNKR